MHGLTLPSPGPLKPALLGGGAVQVCWRGAQSFGRALSSQTQNSAKGIEQRAKSTHSGFAVSSSSTVNPIRREITDCSPLKHPHKDDCLLILLLEAPLLFWPGRRSDRAPLGMHTTCQWGELFCWHKHKGFSSGVTQSDGVEFCCHSCIGELANAARSARLHKMDSASAEAQGRRGSVTSPHLSLGKKILMCALHNCIQYLERCG